MRLADFSSFIEVATTLNIALVAIEYVKTYTNVLCSQVFNFQDFINKSFVKCEKILVDRMTLEHIPSVSVEGRSTNSLIEKAKRDREKIEEKIEDEKGRFNNKIKSVCEAKNISSVGLWHFLLGLVALYVIGIAGDTETAVMKSIWCCMIVCTIVYSVVGWLSKEESENNVFCNYSSLRHSIVYFVLALGISLLVSIFCCVNGFFYSIWDWFLPVTLPFIYSNFLAAVIKVWGKAHAIKNEIKESSDEIQNNCSKLKAEVDSLLTVCSISNRLGVESPSIDVSDNHSQNNTGRE